MSGLSHYAYCLLRYVPNVVREESVNLAVIVAHADRVNDVCKISFANEWESRVRLFDPDADLVVLRSILKDVQQQLLSEDRRSEMIRLMEDSFSNAIQMTQWRKCLLTDNGDAIDVFVGELLGEARNGYRVPADSR
jgi:hypothetical protein